MMEKKTYTKPVLFMEQFSLTQTLSNCSVRIGFADHTCVLLDQDSTNTMKNMALIGYFSPYSCEKFVSGHDTEDGICYHTSAALVFSS